MLLETLKHEYGGEEHAWSCHYHKRNSVRGRNSTVNPIDFAEKEQVCLHSRDYFVLCGTTVLSTCITFGVVENHRMCVSAVCCS